jgi:hypothetical protein
MLLRADRIMAMNRRTFVSGITMGLLAAPLAPEAQQVRTNRIGVLTVSATEPLRQSLRELGYVERCGVPTNFGRRFRRCSPDAPRPS